jgi:DNA-binding winged helix-turn-helix (wHTH) protein
MTMNVLPTPCSRRRNPLPQGATWSRRPTAASADLEFGRFRVLLRRRQLLADGVPVEIGTRAFEILMVLLEADGALVTKGELLSRVWPSVVVSEENVKFQVAALRKALGADRDVIRTEVGRGYRFTGMLRSDPAGDPGRRPMRSRERSGLIFIQSCRQSLWCGVSPAGVSDFSSQAPLPAHASARARIFQGNPALAGGFAGRRCPSSRMPLVEENSLARHDSVLSCKAEEM